MLVILLRRDARRILPAVHWWKCLQRLASKSSKSVSQYRKTLNLPQTSFPLSMKDGVSAQRELKIQRASSFADLYKWQQNEQRDKEFILHDGPPYANGNTHVGHALNKILKDITNRYKVLSGYKVHYVPGWDCHGLPIEQKALENLRLSHTEMEPLDIRHTANAFAKKAIKMQRTAFERWGVMADWSNCYYTFDKKYEAEQLEVFFAMFEKGYVYQDYMPVFWSPSSRTALAEAELEYNDHHESTAVYVRFPLSHLPDRISTLRGENLGRSWAVIWTTTPWTLPANRAICYGPGIKYDVLQDRHRGDSYIVSSEFREAFEMLMGANKFEVLGTVTGSELDGITYTHPFYTDMELPLLPANHVTAEKGTGLVHTAPAHGPEDFQVAVSHRLNVDCHVDESGRYTSDCGQALAGISVLGEGNQTVLSMLGDHVLHTETFRHSYPYDWRTKQPVILRASRQWFVDTRQACQAALEALGAVAIWPAASGHGMAAQLERRTYWCISRQRVWGVPLPIFYRQPDGAPLLTRHSIDHIKNLVLKHGTDCWWTLSQDELLPAEVVEQSGFDPSAEFTRGDDVLDIWFDSGTSWAGVLNGKIADVYLEGLDQFGGWFQSSLLTSIVARQEAPYRSLVVHGFTVDEQGMKMSKSVGNVIDPQVIINGGKDREREPAYGADVLRWWAAQAGLDTTVSLGPTLIDSCHQQVFRVRKALRFLMGNLSDFSPHAHYVDYDLLLPQDKFLLHQLYKFCHQVKEAYEGYNFSRVVQLIEKFTSTQVSGFHCHITKDRLYCSSSDSPWRRSAQTAQHATLQVLLQVLAPILPHLAEEAYLASRDPLGTDPDSIFKTEFYEADLRWNNPDLANAFDIVLNMRSTFNSAIAAHDPVQFDVVVCAKPLIFDKIKWLQEEEQTSNISTLAEVLQCSTTSMLSRPPLVIPDESQPVEGKCPITMPDGTIEEHKYLLVILSAEKFHCDRCRRYTSTSQRELCERCADVLADGWDS